MLQHQRQHRKPEHCSPLNTGLFASIEAANKNAQAKSTLGRGDKTIVGGHIQYPPPSCRTNTSGEKLDVLRAFHSTQKKKVTEAYECTKVTQDEHIADNTNTQPYRTGKTKIYIHRVKEKI